MSKPTTTCRYDKYQLINVDGINYELYTYIEKLRTDAKKITKSDISQMLGRHDSWYSQFTTKNYTQTITRDDLIKIISIIKYSAKTEQDLHTYKPSAEYHIDAIMKLTPKKPPRELYPQEILDYMQTISSSDYLDNRFEETIFQLFSVLQNIYDGFDAFQKGHLLNLLHQLMINLALAPMPSLHYYSLPFSALFAGTPLNPETDKQQLTQELFTDFDAFITKYSSVIRNENFSVFLNLLNKNIKSSMSLQTKSDISLPRTVNSNKKTEPSK